MLLSRHIASPSGDEAQIRPAGPTSPPAPATRLFGQYLVDEGVISPADLREALALMRTVNSTIGELAVTEGLVTAAEAEEIHRLQREIDGRWGDIALTLGIGKASAERIERLVWEQDLGNLRLSDALVEIGVLTATQVDEYIDAYERDQHPSPLPDDAADPELVAYARRVMEGLPRLARRVIDSPVRMAPVAPWNGAHFDHCARILVGQPVSCAVHLSVERRVARALAEAFVEAQRPRHDKYPLKVSVYDQAVADFLSLLTGQTCRELAVSAGISPAFGPCQSGLPPGGTVAIQIAFAQGAGWLVFEKSA